MHSYLVNGTGLFRVSREVEFHKRFMNRVKRLHKVQKDTYTKTVKVREGKLERDLREVSGRQIGLISYSPRKEFD